MMYFDFKIGRLNFSVVAGRWFISVFAIKYPKFYVFDAIYDKETKQGLINVNGKTLIFGGKKD